MRELKFRIWDKENNCFFKPTYEAYKGRLEDLSISLSGDLTMHTYDTPLIHESCFPNRFVIQQYTGLKDKNGRKVYEGDILKESDIITEIVFRNYAWQEKLVSSPHNHLTDYFPFSKNMTRLSLFGEVIGNIHENPELLQ